MPKSFSITEIEGKPALCFDTGLDSRSFAQAKFAQYFTEPGFLVLPDGSNEPWKAAGVIETDGTMRIWGPLFRGARLDLLVDSADEATRQQALQAVTSWIRAKMFLGQTRSSPNPSAAFIGESTVLFAPETLAARCMLAEGGGDNRYTSADLEGMEVAAFCAGTMLYRVLIGVHPFPDTENFHQDMREGVFLPPHLEAPGLDEKLCDLIQAALLLPAAGKQTQRNVTAILGDLLNILMEGGKEAAIASFFRTLSEEENARLAKDKERYLKRKNAAVKTTRFVTRNKAILMGTAAALLAALLVTQSLLKSAADRPSTKGMDSLTVIHCYYSALDTLDHILMEVCIKGADKSDINMAVNLFVINRVRQAYESASGPSIVPASEWKEQGGELPAPDVFGITDLAVDYLSGSEDEGQIRYLAHYTLWFPNEEPSVRRSDELTLTRTRGNWRITEIKRTAE
jgi:hypothetical protein